MIKYFLWALVSACTVILFGGCAIDRQEPPPAVAAVAAPVDYGDPGNWVMLPNVSAEQHEVDVFYVYPTIFTSREPSLMHWNTEKIRTKARNIARQQTGPFADTGNIYAPFVRQADLSGALEDLKAERVTGNSMRQGAADTAAAFRYYLKHFNKGRPVILVGHSQGAFDLLELLKTDFKDESLRRKLVGAYLFGCPVTAADRAEYPHLKTAQGEYDIGVIISWNTEAPGVKKSLFTGRPGTYCINPLNWKTDATPAPAADNPGAVFFDNKGNIVQEYPRFCGAVINPATGALEVVPRYPGEYELEVLGKGVYHTCDIYFFYRNVAENAKARASAYFRQ